MKKILLVDDDVIMSSTLAYNLEQSGFEVVKASDGEEGLKLAIEKKPDLILLDILLPKMDGITLIKKIREDAWGKKASIIVLTNLSSPENIAEATEWTKDYLIKSDWKIEDLIRHVKNKLEGKK